MINWKVRLKNKNFWVAIIPMILLLVQKVGIIFGFEIDLGALGNQIVEVVEIVFVILGLLGVVNDPTTAGLSDSTLAMTYDVPKVSVKGGDQYNV